MAGLEGRTLGGYQLTQQIGAGAVTEVFRGQPTTGGRETAVRIIHAEFASQPGFRERHQRAIAAGTRLSQHPHVLPLVGHGEDGSHLYLASSYVAEGTLTDWLKRGGKLGAADIGPFFKQLANAVAYAQSASVVHGNIKPSNIFMFEGRHVLLGDFGMLWDPAQMDRHRPGPAAQAAEWLAPESARGQFSQASDMYSLGLILFLLITGRTPFRGTTPGEVLDAHARQSIPSVTFVEQSLSPQFREFDAVLAKALAKRPEERYASAAQMMQAVEQASLAAQSAPASALPAGWPQPHAVAPMGAPRPGPGVNGGSGFPGAGMPGMQQAAPLNPLLGQGSELGGLMDEGGIAGKWSEAPRPEFMARAEQVRQAEPARRQEPVRRPEPIDERTLLMPAPQQQPQQYYSPPLLPQQAPQQQFGAPFGPQQGMPFAHQPGTGVVTGGAPPAMPGIPSGAPAFAAPPVFPKPDVAPQSGQGARDQKNFSAQDLGLPRLTYADLGTGLSKEIEDQMREDGEGSSLRVIVEGDPEPHTYTARGKPGRRAQPNDSMEMSAAYPAARRSRTYSEEMSAQLATPRGGRRNQRDEQWSEDMASVEMPQPRGRRDRYDADGGYSEEYQARSPRGRASQRPRQEDEDDGEHRVNPKLLATFLFGVIPLLLASTLGIIAIRPQVCPNHVCDKLSKVAHKYMPVLDRFGGPASFSEAPSQVTVNAQIGQAQSGQITLTGTSGAAVSWQASADLDWVSVSPASGTVPQGGNTSLSVLAKPSSVKPGTYTANVTITGGLTTLVVPVKVVVIQGPVMAPLPASLQVSSCGVAVNLPVQNTGDAALTVTATGSSSAVTVLPSPLKVDPGATGTLTVTLKCSLARHGAQYAVHVTSDGGGADVPVKY